MKKRILALAAMVTMAVATPTPASPIDDILAVSGGGSIKLPPYLQCVPYARQVTGVRLFGDAHTWWGQAAGHYARGFAPKVGAVMTFKPHGKMVLGHVAAVSRIVAHHSAAPCQLEYHPWAARPDRE